jgi:hypothetical protein
MMFEEKVLNKIQDRGNRANKADRPRADNNHVEEFGNHDARE